MNEAWGVMMFAFSVALLGMTLLAVSMLTLPVKALRLFSILGRILFAASFLALLAAILLRPLLLGFLEHIAIFGAPVVGLLTSLVSIRRFLRQINGTHIPL
jgi:hypothetical protein